MYMIFTNEKVSKDKWYLDACFGDSIINNRFQRIEMVCTKTLYSYVDLGFMNVKNSDLPIKLKINKKKRVSRLNKIKLGRSIEERDKSIDSKEEFGSKFSQVFKTITSDNVLEFSSLSKLENSTDTKVYFTHPYFIL